MIFKITYRTTIKDLPTVKSSFVAASSIDVAKDKLSRHHLIKKGKSSIFQILSCSIVNNIEYLLM